MDWATQPDLFRRYEGAPLIPLEIAKPGDEPSYASVFSVDSSIPSSSLNFHSVSRLLYDSMALSAWKSAGGVSWPLRINPSSGNLHPTECYLLCGAIPDLCAVAMVSHYAVKEHGLEVRAEIPRNVWEKLTAGLPGGTLLLGLSSIHWRESWKYGERAYRYCQLDVGHALAAVALAAAALGWETRLLDDPGSDKLGQLLGVSGLKGANAEEPDCLLAIYPRGATGDRPILNLEAVPDFGDLNWLGIPNSLSPSCREWQRIDEVAQASRKPTLYQDYLPKPEPETGVSFLPFTGPFRRIIRQRRSAMAMDGVSIMPLASFYALLERTIARGKAAPFALLPWPSCVDLALFVHRVDDLIPGLYLLLRNRRHREELRELLDAEFLWEKPASCPDGLDLYHLASGDARNVAMNISCAQDIAAKGCFSLGMLAEFSRTLHEIGPWFYPRLFWESGMIGQVLYLEAEAAGLRGTGIGCFFDDPMHELLGLKGNRYQDLYHFTVGGPVEDRRLATMPAYPVRQHEDIGE
ncbi:MAG: SagB/ThcOx family dehydrogenase [Deltaproteobacteria bacterium]|nr:SagB/ThcOx family dehydrogenase [Deltaproteobacteria bacterium]